MKLSENPIVQASQKADAFSPSGDIDAALIKGGGASARSGLPLIDASRLKETILSSGADDVGIVELGRAALDSSRPDLLDVLPDCRSVVVMAFRVNPSHLRSLPHSVVDQEFKQAWADIGHTGRTVVRRLRQEGIRAINMPAGFPQEMDRWPGRTWLTQDKIYAVEAGLGHMGINRLVIHPGFGAAVLLATLLVAADVDAYDRPLDDNPCIRCGLCLKVCPTGAVKQTDNFDMLACLTHNYRERLGGFQNWIEQVVESRDVSDYRQRISDRESVSMWQHLAVGAQNKCDRCMAVCPAGEMAVGEFLADRKGYSEKYVNRFRDLPETVYAVRGSAVEAHVASHFPSKRVKQVSNGIHPASAAGFLTSLPLAFQPHRAADLDAVFHFTFTGEESLTGTVVIRDRTVTVENHLTGDPDIHVIADSRSWIRFLNREAGLLKSLLFRKIRLKGDIRLMKRFAACFPS